MLFKFIRCLLLYLVGWLLVLCPIFSLWVGRHNERNWVQNEVLVVLDPVDPSGLLGGQCCLCPEQQRALSRPVLSCWPHSPPRLAGFKSRQANKAQTGLTLNYPHEWRANPIFIFTWPWNVLCGLNRPDLPGCFRFAWMNSVTIFNMSTDCW